ncbi:hypothetical protein GE061_009951 [Apolygus lucorum]|uniref:Uncharacterized protein n=1 Tax=Apolygus lucorum TaxID=248454 RepID=A0A8S9Y388_APOLU|nr:hypothetical protein GE061_009951 [Apolygus lucorum]
MVVCENSTNFYAVLSISRDVAYAHEPVGFLQGDSPRSKEPHWILGKKHLPQNEEALKRDIISRLWFSYRKGFVQIGDSG